MNKGLKERLAYVIEKHNNMFPNETLALNGEDFETISVGTLSVSALGGSSNKDSIYFDLTDCAYVDLEDENGDYITFVYLSELSDAKIDEIISLSEIALNCK